MLREDFDEPSGATGEMLARFGGGDRAGYRDYQGQRPPARGEREEPVKSLLERLDEASATLEEVRRLCEALGEEDASYDCSMALGIVEEVSATVETRAGG